VDDECEAEQKTHQEQVSEGGGESKGERNAKGAWVACDLMLKIKLPSTDA
jgi:hypothetical protein